MLTIRPLETFRLRLRPLELADASQAQVLFPQWEIVRYLARVVPWPYPDDGVLTSYRDHALPAMTRGDEWHWSLRLKSAPDQLIGCISLMRDENNNRGFWLGLPWQRRGFMSEAVEVVTDYWFHELKFACDKSAKGDRKHAFAQNFAEKRHACRSCGRERLRRRPLLKRDMGNHRRGVARLSQLQPAAHSGKPLGHIVISDFGPAGGPEPGVLG
jgi:hypothetical protein